MAQDSPCSVKENKIDHKGDWKIDSPFLYLFWVKNLRLIVHNLRFFALFHICYILLWVIKGIIKGGAYG